MENDYAFGLLYNSKNLMHVYLYLDNPKDLDPDPVIQYFFMMISSNHTSFSMNPARNVISSLIEKQDIPI